MGPPLLMCSVAAVYEIPYAPYGKTTQFHEIRKQLDLQLQRTGQLQVQLDQIHGFVKRLVKHDFLLRVTLVMTCDHPRGST